MVGFGIRHSFPLVACWFRRCRWIATSTGTDGPPDDPRSAMAFTSPPAEKASIARYARGRDYHYAHRDRMKALRKRLLVLDPTLETYAAVDTGVAPVG